jgi:hypothetical protein
MLMSRLLLRVISLSPETYPDCLRIIKEQKKLLWTPCGQ